MEEIIIKFIEQNGYVHGMGMINKQMVYKSLFEILESYEKFKKENK